MNTDLIGCKLGEPLVGAILTTASHGTIITRDGVNGEADVVVKMEACARELRSLLLAGGSGSTDAETTLEIKTHYISAWSQPFGNGPGQVKGPDISCIYSKEEWRDRLSNAHALLVWVEPLQQAVLLLAPVGGLAPGFESFADLPRKEGVKAYSKELKSPMTSQCKALGGRCCRADAPSDAPSSETPHVATVCPEARPSPQSTRLANQCAAPISPLTPVLSTEWTKAKPGEAKDAEHLFKEYVISKQCSYAHSTPQEVNYLMRRLLSPFIAIGFRPGVHIDLDWRRIQSGAAAAPSAAPSAAAAAPSVQAAESH